MDHSDELIDEHPHSAESFSLCIHSLFTDLINTSKF